MRRICLFSFAALVVGTPAMAGTYQMMFDVFSPAGITCEATPPPGGAVRLSRGLSGNPVVTVVGSPLREAKIQCRLADGSRWQATAQETVPPGTMHANAHVMIRPGAASGATLMDVDGRDDVVMRSFLPLP